MRSRTPNRKSASIVRQTKKVPKPPLAAMVEVEPGERIEPTEQQGQLPSVPAPAINHLLHRSAQLADAFVENALVNLHLTARQFAVLDGIDRRTDSNQNQLCQATGIDRSTLVNIINRLQQRDLVKRRKSMLDLRNSVLVLTEAGASVLAQARPAVENANATLLRRLPVDAQDAFAGHLEYFLVRGDGAYAES